MQNEYFNKQNSTGLIMTVSCIATIAASLIPSNNYTIPYAVSSEYADYAKSGTPSALPSNAQKKEGDKSAILLSFGANLLENTKDLEIDIAHIVSDNFWDMYDRF